MPTPEQARTLIRFGLDQLRTRNAHHEFEHLCRHLARKRICSNILPSTGPVSAGGDQGRDFETFRTYIASNAPDRSIFAALASDIRLAFACTVQANDLPSKIRSDTDTICASGFSVSNIHVFCVEDLPTAKRHEIQEWARQTHNVEVDIHDGFAISELLADPEVFWIASRYLDIPADQAPEISSDVWYQELASRVRQEPRRCATHGQFFELKRLVRHATHREEPRSDLPEWIARLETAPEADRRLRRSALYEIFVASLRGLQTLEGREPQIRSYCDAIESLESPGELRDAACLLSYCVGAVAHHVLVIAIDELARWRTILVARVEQLLDLARTANARTALLDLRWYIAVTPTPGERRRPILDEAFPWLEQLLNDVGEARMFPLSNLIDNLTSMQSLMDVRDPRRYQRITSGLDAALASREGEKAVAFKLRDRAMAFLEAKKPLLALKFLHDTNVKWFSQETLEGSLLSQLVIAYIYDSLGLSAAAQYFALGAAFIAYQGDAPGIRARAPRGLFCAAEYAYHAGEWCRFLELGELALRAHALLVPTPGDLERYPELYRLAFCASCAVALLEKLDRALAARVLRRLGTWQIDWLLNDMLEAARRSRLPFSIDKTWSQLQSQLYGRPMSDAGRTRRIEWRQLGVRWRFRWLNRLAHAAVGEQLIATLQIILADMAEDDLCLLPATVTARVRIGPLHIVREPSNVGSRWTITVPTDLGIDEAASTTMAVAGAILRELSLLPSRAFLELLEAHLKTGLSSKVFIARPYAELLQQFTAKRAFARARSMNVSLLKRRFRVRQHRALAWRRDLGPFYSSDQARELLVRRYSRLIGPIRETVSALREDASFRAVLERLRASGWRDWHVLSAIYTVSFNHRAQTGGHGTPDGLARFRRIFEGATDGTFAEPIPLAVFSEEALRSAQNLNMLSTLRGLGHECHQGTPAFRAVSRFLGARYRYWIDDIEHDDPFAPAAAVASD